MTEEIRFQTGFRAAATGEPGLVMHDDGTVWLVAADGSETQISGGGGSGLPSWWSVDNDAQTVTIAPVDEGPSDIIALTMTAPDEAVGFIGLVVQSNDEATYFKLDLFNGFTAHADGIDTFYGAEFADIQSNIDGTLLRIAQYTDDPTQPIVQVYKPNGSSGEWGITKDGAEYKINSGFSGPADGDVAASQIVEWFDDTENAIASRFKARDSASNLFSGKVATMISDGSSFSGVDKPSVDDATFPALLAALVTLGLVIDDT